MTKKLDWDKATPEEKLIEIDRLMSVVVASTKGNKNALTLIIAGLGLAFFAYGRCLIQKEIIDGKAKGSADIKGGAGEGAKGKGSGQV